MYKYMFIVMCCHECRENCVCTVCGCMVRVARSGLYRNLSTSRHSDSRQICATIFICISTLKAC